MIDLSTIRKRRFRNVSVSQYETFLDCPRKWFLSWPAGLKGPPTESQQRGTECHDSLEYRALEGAVRDDPYAPYVRAVDAVRVHGQTLLPPPGEPVAAELEFRLPTHIGVPWLGVIDLIRDEISPMLLLDWKTTSDIRYAKTPAEVYQNIQLGSYGEFMYREGVPHTDIIRAGLIYIEIKKKGPPKKKLPRVVPSLVDLDRSHVTRLWESTKPTLEAMAETYEYDDPHEITPNVQACPKFGGCPHRAYCGLSPMAGVSAPRHLPAKNTQKTNDDTEETPKMSLLARMKNRNGTNGQTAQSAPPPTQTAPAPAPATAAPSGPKPGGFANRLAARRAGSGAPAPAPEVPTGVTPPDAPSRETPIPAGETPQAAQESQEPVQETPKRRGGRRKAQAAPPAQEAVQEAAPEPSPESPDKRTRATRTKKGLVLYVGCMPMKGAGEITMLEDWAQPMLMELDEWAREWANENKRGDVEHFMQTPFAEQKAALSVACQERVTKTTMPEAIYVQPGTQLERDLLPLLIPHATDVVRNTR